jgi:hypothetical protein
LDWVRKQTGGGSAAAPAKGLATLQARLQELIAERAKPDRRGAVLQRKVAAEIAPFLGHRAANRLLGSVSENGEDLLCIIEPVLANFLGDRAAAELVSHLVDSAIGRT